MQNQTTTTTLENFVSNSTDTHAVSLDTRSFREYKPSFRFHKQYVVGHYLVVEIEESEIEKIFAVIPKYVRTTWGPKDFIKATVLSRLVITAFDVLA